MHKRSNRIWLAPTDLSNFLSCRHLSARDLAALHSGAKRPARYGPVIDELKARGLAHEQRFLEHLRTQGLSISAVGDAGAVDASGMARTRAAMGEGVDVIYQPVLADSVWLGRADFLRRVDTPSEFGAWSYEVVDTKLARDTRAGTILQLCVYTYLLSQLQGVRPAHMYVVTPGNDFAPLIYRTDDFAAYFRLLDRQLGEFLRRPSPTYPELVSHCDLCAWWDECESRRRADDHLCYVAGISASQIQALRTLGINRLADLAELDEVPAPARGSQDALVRMRDQARVQWIGRQRDAPYYELKQPFDADHGLALLPEPTPDDIFLDLEGNHFAENGVQEYLTGYLSRGPGSGYTYTALWARTPHEERRAFEQFVDLATQTRMRNPNAHIFHFAAYEPAAIKRLMGRYATRETEVDVLLRGAAFVDLYTAVRRSLIAGVERYSIKDLEPFFAYERRQSLRAAALSRRLVEQAIDAGDWDESMDGHRQAVEDYNREDCESAQRLRDWLEQLRSDVAAAGHGLPRPDLRDGEASEEVSALDRELRALRDGLLAGVSDDPEERTGTEQAQFVLAHMMEFHRREDKAGWWEYFRVLGLEENDYAEERRALSGLVYVETLQALKAPLQRYHFPPQELDARPRDEVYDAHGNRVGTVVDVNYAAGTIDIKKRKDTGELHPAQVVLFNRVAADPLRESLMRFGRAVMARGFTLREPYQAAVRLLLREPPLGNGARHLQQRGESTVAAACRLVQQLDGRVLAIQGPPGTGKTFTGARMICALVKAGKKVGVTAVSHKVILNLLEEAAAAATEQGFALRAVHKHDGQYAGDANIQYMDKYPRILEALGAGQLDVLGGTAWQWAKPEFEQTVDVLIVDEAGQMALSNVLATAAAGRGLVLLGDPQQLEQPLQSSHPEGSEVSALYHLLDGEDTMPPHKGLFLDETYRLHPEIAGFTSETYYEGRVVARPELVHQAILPPSDTSRFGGAGLRYVAVAHSGNQAKSLEEVAVIGDIVAELLGGARWRDKGQQVAPLTPRDLLIVAPYNAQVAALIEALPQLKDRIGTVDRFQGQEAPVVIYSMTSSSPDVAPRGMEFLYNRHRFNVATSRARALCILVGNPALFAPECKSPRQMKMANALCRYLELARRV